MIPMLETERLRLRGHSLADFDRFAALWADERMAGPIGLSPCSVEEAWSRFTRYAGHWAMLGFGTWAVEEKASGHVIGEVGLFDFKRDLPPDFAGRPEHGWAFASAAHGKGYASEAVRASIAWGGAHFSPFEPFCIIGEDNAPSLKLAARAGYCEVLRTLFKGRPAIFLSLQST